MLRASDLFSAALLEETLFPNMPLKSHHPRTIEQSLTGGALQHLVLQVVSFAVGVMNFQFDVSKALEGFYVYF